MASNLYWRPVPSGGPAPGDDRLKLILRDRHGMSSPRDPILLGSQDRFFLDGLRAAGVDGAADLFKLIEKHGEIEVWEQS